MKNKILTIVLSQIALAMFLYAINNLFKLNFSNALFILPILIVYTLILFAVLIKKPKINIAYNQDEIKEAIIDSKSDVEEPKKVIEAKNKAEEIVGSSKNHRYHKKSCKFVDVIAPENKVEGKSEQYFEKNNYSKCKICFK